MLNKLYLLFIMIIATLMSGVHTSTAQTMPASITQPLNTKTVLFDFEGGNFDGWTLTGDCWDKAPATPKTFVDKQGNSVVSGIVGSGYLTTLNKSAATTGKSVSKAFTIDKPFLTFKIGGGRYPKEACLNLIVDGKIVRTETGDYVSGDIDYKPILHPAYWDVYALMGKTAHLEIVDATASQQRGYIMLDDLRLTETLNTPEQQTVTRMAENWRRKYNLPGVWCAVIKNGKIVAYTVVGLKNIEKNLPATDDDYLAVGSVSKPITGSLIAEFVAKGKIKYETTIGEVFPDFIRLSPNSPLRNATLRQLMTHTAGLPAYPLPMQPCIGTEYRLGELKSSLNDERVIPPGTKYIYNGLC